MRQDKAHIGHISDFDSMAQKEGPYSILFCTNEDTRVFILVSGSVSVIVQAIERKREKNNLYRHVSTPLKWLQKTCIHKSFIKIYKEQF